MLPSQHAAPACLRPPPPPPPPPPPRGPRGGGGGGGGRGPPPPPRGGGGGVSASVSACCVREARAHARSRRRRNHGRADKTHTRYGSFGSDVSVILNLTLDLCGRAEEEGGGGVGRGGARGSASDGGRKRERTAAGERTRGGRTYIVDRGRREHVAEEEEEKEQEMVCARKSAARACGRRDPSCAAVDGRGGRAHLCCEPRCGRRRATATASDASDVLRRRRGELFFCPVYVCVCNMYVCVTPRGGGGGGGRGDLHAVRGFFLRRAATLRASCERRRLRATARACSAGVRSAYTRRPRPSHISARAPRPAPPCSRRQRLPRPSRGTARWCPCPSRSPRRWGTRTRRTPAAGTAAGGARPCRARRPT